jgi:hypothetical protein
MALRAHADRAAEGQGDARPAHRADRRRRSAHLRHGEPVPQVGIYSPAWAAYEPEDIGSMLYYREATNGQILEEGHQEAGALSSWTRRRRRYSVHGLPMLPFYIYYSMFGFQRVGDLIWAAADQRARGFLIGATSGKHHARRRRPAASGRHEPSRGIDRSELPRLRSGVRRRSRGDRRPRHARDGEVIERAARRVLLRHGDERELRAAVGLPSINDFTRSASRGVAGL